MIELTTEQREQLVVAALQVRVNAYAPYSQFAVGAAVLSDAGQMFAGCNVENASYGLTTCGERAATFAAISAGSRTLVALALATPGGCSPCGACREVLSEFCDDMWILLVDSDLGKCVDEVFLSELLPRRFCRE